MFFFKQKTAYEVRIRDWSSDVCSSDLALGVGDRVLARIEERGQGHVAHPMKRLARGEATTLGVLHAEAERLWLRAIDKKERRELPISDAGGAQPGYRVMVEKAGHPPRITVREVERLGDPFATRSFSLIANHQKETE